MDGIGTGGGFGAPGGSPSTGMSGGSWYGLTRSPSDIGSGGGNSSTGRGGSGGGFLELNIAQTLTVEGES